MNFIFAIYINILARKKGYHNEIRLSKSRELVFHFNSFTKPVTTYRQKAKPITNEMGFSFFEQTLYVKLIYG